MRPEAIPPHPDAAAALYRSLLADRRMLIVLDNAAGAAQVRPLLPGTANCLTLITSRSRLPGLAIRDGAHRITLGTLPKGDSVALLRSVTAVYRPHDDPHRLAELAQLCAHLPLALRIAAERAASRPHMSVEELIAELRDDSGLWDALSTGDDEEAEAVRTVFAWSYRALPAEAARLFRLLGLHPGPDLSLGTATALVALPVGRVRQLLDILVGAHLLEQTAPDRYQFHDLLRAYAMDQARREEPPDDRDVVLRRLLDWYLHRADAAQEWISPAEDRLPLAPPDPAVPPVPFEHYDAAVDWSEREFPNLVAAVRLAQRLGWAERGWRLAGVLWNAQPPSTTTVDWLPAGRAGLAMAREAGDRAGEALLLTDLGMAHVRRRELVEGAECHRAALVLWRARDDQKGEADSLNLLGLVHLRRRELASASECFSQALRLFREVGAVHWAATAVANLANSQLEAGRLGQARETAERALAEQRALGDRRGEGNALRLISEVQRESGELEPASHSARQAVEIALELRGQRLEGYWLLTLGAAQLANGAPGAALVSYQRAAALHRRFADRSREALAWQGAGEVYRRLGRCAEAADFFRRAFVAHGELGDGWCAASALDELGDVLVAEDGAAARRHWAEALGLLGDADDPRAQGLRTRLRNRLARAR